MSGSLVLVGTPIGNLGDLSPRAIATLASADVIACEDTRHTRRLLSAAGVRGRTLIAVHEHNEAAMVAALLDRIRGGEQVAVVTDAGMPGVSDPGERLVRAAAAEGFAVDAVPGPSAVVTALVVSGLPTARWCFEGFLPRKGKARAIRLTELAAEPRTIVLYEAPRRLAATFADLSAALGSERRVALARELTKVFAEVWRGNLREACQRAATASAEPRGEHVIIIEGAAKGVGAGDDEVAAALSRAMTSCPSRRQAVAEVAEMLGVPKRRVYALALDLPAPSGAVGPV